jgi:hypothetical protein
MWHHQPPASSHQPPATSHQPPATSHQPGPPSLEHVPSLKTGGHSCEVIFFPFHKLKSAWIAELSRKDLGKLQEAFFEVRSTLSEVWKSRTQLGNNKLTEWNCVRTRKKQGGGHFSHEPLPLLVSFHRPALALSCVCLNSEESPPHPQALQPPLPTLSPQPLHPPTDMFFPHQFPELLLFTLEVRVRRAGSCVWSQLSWTGHLSNSGTEPSVMRPLKGLSLQKPRGGIWVPSHLYRTWFKFPELSHSLTFLYVSHCSYQVSPVPILGWWQQFALESWVTGAADRQASKPITGKTRKTNAPPPKKWIVKARRPSRCSSGCLYPKLFLGVARGEVMDHLK